MKTLIFTNDCRDKYTNEFYEVETVKDFEDERADEILATGYAELLKAEEVEEEQEEQGKTADVALENGMVVNLNDLSKEKLIELCKKQNIATKGTKEELIERLLARNEG